MGLYGPILAFEPGAEGPVWVWVWRAPYLGPEKISFREICYTIDILYTYYLSL
jgi:hypothetical protein